MTGTRDLAILTGGNREMSLKETEIREFQRLKYAKKIKLSFRLVHLINVGNTLSMT